MVPSPVAMEPIGFSLGVIPELRHQVQSVMTRVEKFRHGNGVQMKVILKYKYGNNVRDSFENMVPN